jgi:3-phosphoshikimate 1-carboxyvinyltransferase
MDIKTNPTVNLNGEITAPSSKSYSHRAFIAASFSDGISIIKNPLTSGDVAVTIDILKKLGVTVHRETGNSYIVSKGPDFRNPVKEIIDCKNSGTSLRIFSALSLLIEGGLSLQGEFLKRKRPIIPLLDALKSLGGEYELLDETISVRRANEICGTVQIRGDISSQFITALLFLSSLIKCEERSFIEINITSPITSLPYISITTDLLRSFGVSLYEKIDDEKKGKFLITCAQNYRPQIYTVPGDFSSASFMIAASVLSSGDSNVIINNLDTKNPQGDKKIIEILKEMGANIKINEEEHILKIKGNLNKSPLNGFEIDCYEIPDLFPILAVVGAFAQGRTTLYNAGNLRLKESDRIAVMARELKKMGVNVEEGEDELTVHHCDKFTNSQIDHENDHRIAMACCIAGLFSKQTNVIKNFEIVDDSYSTFIGDLMKLGAKIEVI